MTPSARPPRRLFTLAPSRRRWRPWWPWVATPRVARRAPPRARPSGRAAPPAYARVSGAVMADRSGGDARGRHQLAGVPADRGDPRQARAGQADASAEQQVRGARPHQRPGVPPQPLPGRAGRLGAPAPDPRRGVRRHDVPVPPRAAPTRLRGAVPAADAAGTARQRRLPAGPVQPADHARRRALVARRLDRRRGLLAAGVAAHGPGPTVPWSRGCCAATGRPGVRVGFYSTPYMWGQILGAARYGLPEWRSAGPTSRPPPGSGARAAPSRAVPPCWRSGGCRARTSTSPAPAAPRPARCGAGSTAGDPAPLSPSAGDRRDPCGPRWRAAARRRTSSPRRARR